MKKNAACGIKICKGCTPEKAFDNIFNYALSDPFFAGGTIQRGRLIMATVIGYAPIAEGVKVLIFYNHETRMIELIETTDDLISQFINLPPHSYMYLMEFIANGRPMIGGIYYR